jgi:hypothetical protein
MCGRYDSFSGSGLNCRICGGCGRLACQIIGKAQQTSLVVDKMLEIKKDIPRQKVSKSK